MIHALDVSMKEHKIKQRIKSKSFRLKYFMNNRSIIQVENLKTFD